MDRGWKRSEVHARKSQHCCEETFKEDSGENSESKEKSCRESVWLLRKYISNQSCTDAGRNIDGKSLSDEISDGDEELAIGPWRKAILVIK